MRVLPWWQEELRRSPQNPMSSCRTCMQANDLQTRQLFGCGWSPPPPEHLRPFVQPPEPLQYRPQKDDEGQRVVNLCPGYTTSLPQVIEIARARFWAEKGNLREFCGDEQPSEALMVGIEVLAGAVNELDMARATPSAKGGIG